ncbi:RNA dependent RNA polymerase domain-containing protein [Hirsutella rhossiliensis]|uniref:RNA-dependent RNA polymerase n=1 Tax=Hirsutella rhossiliensis TaxID=111463 RepID=A0A9P8N5L1_9HYPO|nr:RNA dependent RNA polymerase domain-containing protein [Hirsutella rhossiliensis]KAH0966371.1 RNA dependent RNA polymerase domain-containing protein [Hirsutella rhossiliensis]
MEVFLRNVPVDLTEDSLKKELKPWTNALGILDWACEKARRKDFASITFLNVSDGAKFLAKHEKVIQQQQHDQGPHTKRRREIARLHILQTPVFVTKSKRTVDKFALSHLKTEREDRKKRPDRGSHSHAVRCRLRGIACGKNVFAQPSTTLTFAQQLSTGVLGHAKFGQRWLSATFNDSARMDVPYDIIESLVADHTSPALTLVLTEPPRFFARQSPSTYSMVRWERRSSLPKWPHHEKYAAHCLVYQLWIGVGDSHVFRALRENELVPFSLQGLALDQHPAPHIHDYSTCIRTFEGAINDAGSARRVPFPILFQIQGLVWNNYLHPAAGMRALTIIEDIAKDPKWDRGALPFTTDSMKQLLPKIPYPCPGTDPTHLDPDRLMELAMRIELDLRKQDPFRFGIYGLGLPDHQTWVFKAMVTPTRVILQGPDAESKNRVLRMFPDHGDHFLRVCFCDEDGQDLHFNPRVSNDVVFERYRKVLQAGIQVAGRCFAFLGFSHSSLRSHSTWFLAPFIDQNMQRHDYDTILRTLGDFSEIRIAAKCAARIGQAFSETPYAVDLVRTNIMSRSIPDVKSADGTRVFSDGVGTISREAMEEVWNALPMRSAAPTCLQIRWGGVKGMLSLDSRLRGKVICVREESMMKFPSRDQRELGICDVASKPLRLVLNRQLIKILEDMGTDNDWFKKLQNKALKMLRGVTHTAANTSTFLQYQDIGSALGFPSFIGQLDKMGIDYRRDEFLRSVVEHVVLRELRLLKHKARIPVNKGVTLFGVMDETGFLDEGEVYIAYDKTHAKSGYRMDASLVDGHIIVTRCPALHPGDVQWVKMRTPPAGHTLRDLNNCIVFSQRGRRDLPSQLSGGDLDGDLYNVIWDPLARPKRVFPPADYPRTRPPELGRPVRRDDIADFFIQFMKTDILGLIANRHQILADVSPEGTCDAGCIALAGMHSTAVDFSKTGIPVKLNEMPKAPRTRPDFLSPAPPVKLYDLGQIDFIEERRMDDDDDDDGMGGARHKYHKSEKILGQLYRGVDEKKIWSEDIHRTVNMNGPSVWDQLLGRMQAELDAYGIDTEYKRHSEDAWKLRNLYEDSVYDSMWHFSDNPRTGITEVEVFCGSVLNKRGSQTRQQRDLSIRLKEETDRVLTWMVDLIRKRSTVDGLHNGSSYDDTDLYSVTSRDESVAAAETRDREEAYHGDGDLRSFRVVAAACLLKEMGAMRAHVSAAMAGGGYLGVAAGRQAPQQRGPPRAKKAAAAAAGDEGRAPEAGGAAARAAVPQLGGGVRLTGQFEKLGLS